MPHPMPVNEAERVATLALYQVLDTPPEFAHDALTELAAQICNCPVALISCSMSAGSGSRRSTAFRRTSPNARAR